MKYRDEFNEFDDGFDDDYEDKFEDIEFLDPEDDGIDIDGFYDDEMDDDYEEFDDEPYEIKEKGPKKKLSKDAIINRAMAIAGVIIMGFTIFYGTVAYSVFHKTTAATNNKAAKTEEGEGFFTSPYTDANVTEETKQVLNNAALEPMLTNYTEVDNAVQGVLDVTVKDEMTTYEKVRNIYDYLMYTYDVADTSFIDEDSVYSFCSKYEYSSYFDMELMYRGNQAITNKSGDTKDIASVFALALRRIGLQAYYIDADSYVDGYSISHGYVVVSIYGDYYVFDPAAEDNLTTSLGTNENSYAFFCKTFVILYGTLRGAVQRCRIQIRSSPRDLILPFFYPEPCSDKNVPEFHGKTGGDPGDSSDRTQDARPGEPLPDRRRRRDRRGRLLGGGHPRKPQHRRFGGPVEGV